MVIFQYAAVYKYHYRLFKSIQKQRKMQRLYSPHIQLLHNLYTFRKLLYVVEYG